MDIFGFDINTDLLIIWVAAIASFFSVLSVAFPLLRRVEEKEKIRSAIKDKRRKLFQQIQSEMSSDPEERKKQKEKASSKASLAALFKLEKLGGAGIRDEMLQAGYRNPSAPLVYLGLRLAFPILFALLAGWILSNTDKDLSENLQLVIIIGVAIFGFFLPKIVVKNNRQKRQQEIQLSFPDALDMMLICVQGGISLEGAINRISDAVADHSEVLAEELGLLSAELAMLNDRRGAFNSFAQRVGSGAAKTFANAMVQAEQYGTSISNALRVLAEEIRDMRMAEAERKAASLPPKLTVPMIVFFLPTLFVVILTPAIIEAMNTF